jgi:WD40 repeat protein
MYAKCCMTSWTDSTVFCVQSKGHHRGCTIAACLQDENQVVIHDLETGKLKVIEIKRPWKCASSQHFIAVTTLGYGLHLFTTDGDLVHSIPDSTNSCSAALHPRNTSIVAIGFRDGTLSMWNASRQVYVSSFKQPSGLILGIRFAPDGRLFLSSSDKTASIFKLDDQFQVISSVKLKGHTNWVFDILLLPSSNLCVTGSEDKIIKAWDCVDGTCLHTLTENRGPVYTITKHPKGQYFASGSENRTVVIWSCETFEVLRRITFPRYVLSLVFGENDTLYVGVNCIGVMSCNAITGEIGPVIIPATGSVSSLSLGKPPFSTPRNTSLTHSHS